MFSNYWFQHYGLFVWIEDEKMQAKCLDCCALFYWWAGRGQKLSEQKCPKCSSSNLKRAPADLGHRLREIEALTSSGKDSGTETRN